MTRKTARQTKEPPCTGACGRDRARVRPLRGRRPHARRHPRRPARVGRHRRHAARLRSRERRARAHARPRLRRRHRVRRQAPLPDRRVAHRQDRSRHRRRGRVDSRARPRSDSGLAWAEGSLWVGQYRDRKIHQIDPETGAVIRTIESNRFVTGVTWVDGELWHGTWEGDESEIRRIDPASGAVLERLEMPRGIGVSGLESDGADLFYAGGGTSGKVRAVRRSKATAS